MKINTDGVLLGAMCDLHGANKILDIGTGTGVVALMLAQRKPQVYVDGIDIDETAFEKANANFENSIFNNHLKAYHHSFKAFFELHPENRYDLIVSNPPFHLNALQSPKEARNISKHTDETFFLDLLMLAKNHLTADGTLTLVLPVEISLMLQTTAKDFGLYPKHCIKIKSYPDKAHIRHIITFTRNSNNELLFDDFCIYASQGEHSLQYKATLKDFFTIF
ncbi:tRNA1(Val) (adenine(37)-N6)-methyltransferase [Pedobacter arcticus]|uniref:tRNA1(Val) (adenine(37)-N6)-methyltransferase n=1 Tax=Pedobacter arcticus TaxID=752140 RepID=UPI001ED99110|nr:methyltransferase [Pedobacter arcticus]